jgi:3-methyladenine DNA glycosylase AlkD
MPSSPLKTELISLADPTKAALLAHYFKTGKGEYGEGDTFLGIMVPVQRTLAKKYRELPLAEIETLITDPYHEVRLTALLILVWQMKRADQALQKKIVSFYLSHTKCINNWDLVDLSARDIVGAYLYNFGGSRSLLYKLARSRNIWERRIAVISTFYFIGQNDFTDTLKICESLLSDRHDLIHKAVGWALREVGKRDVNVLKKFLKVHMSRMSRTTLQYAIERFPEKERKAWLVRSR